MAASDLAQAAEQLDPLVGELNPLHPPIVVLAPGLRDPPRGARKRPGRRRSAQTAARRAPLDVAGAILLAGSTIALMLACIWGGDRYAWASPTIVALIAGGVALALALVARERRAPDPIVPLNLLRTRPVAVSSVALFLTTAALFSITVFVPLYLQTTTHATPTQAGLPSSR